MKEHRSLRFRLVGVDLLFDSDDPAFLERAERILGDCRARPGGRAEVLCRTRALPSGEGAHLELSDAQPLDLAEFALALFADRGYSEGPASRPGERVVLDGAGTPVLVASGPDEARLVSPVWRSLAANLGINRALRLQPELLLLHAGSVAVAGRGVVLSGPKASGKSTLSLALAARGNAFLGDEIAVVRPDPWRLEPFPRAPAIREGPRSTRVAERLARGGYASETLPDGSLRTQVRLGELLPGAPLGSTAPLRALVFLEGFGTRPRLERLPAEGALVSRLQALPVCFWRQPRARRLMDFLALVHAVPCFRLEAGEPEETAAHLEAALEIECP